MASLTQKVYKIPLTLHIQTQMRTNIDIDDKLLSAAMRITGQTTKRGTVEEALRRIVQFDGQREALEGLAGLGWEGDLDAMREGRSF